MEFAWDKEKPKQRQNRTPKVDDNARKNIIDKMKRIMNGKQ
jgi:hypothetical protein